MRIHLEPGVQELVQGLGERAITIELTLDFEGDVLKSAVAFPGASEATLGFERIRVDGLGLDVWWRQRLVLASGEPKLTTRVRPRRLVVSRVGQALAVTADYA